MDNLGLATLESMRQADWYNKWLIKKIKPFIKGEILEVGCGIGNFTKDLLDLGEVWAIDIDESYVKKTRKVALPANVGLGNIETGNYFFKKKLFDSIICINVLEHIKDDEAALKNLFSLLKPGGNLVLLVPSHSFLYGEIDRSINHYRRYAKNKLQAHFKKEKIKIIYCKRINMIGAIGWFIAGRVLKEKIVRKDKVTIFNKVAPLYLKMEEIVEPPIGISIMIVGQKAK